MRRIAGGFIRWCVGLARRPFVCFGKLVLQANLLHNLAADFVTPANINQSPRNCQARRNEKRDQPAGFMSQSPLAGGPNKPRPRPQYPSFCRLKIPTPLGVRVLGLEPRTHGLKDRCAIASACYLSASAAYSARYFCQLSATSRISRDADS
jgi:hypothetical protein